jgi:TRAP-type C4-dicarboxylate transport system substrate-binding protein
MPNDLDKLTDAERDALARSALVASEKSRKRAAEYRDRKRASGMVQVAIWVPADKAKQFKAAFEKHVRDVKAKEAQQKPSG